MMRRQKSQFQASPPAQTQRIISRLRRALVLMGILAPLAFLWGCGGVVSGQSTQTSPPPPQTYSISGTISPAAGGSGATATLSGTANATTTADSSGNFTFSGLANGTYTVTPSHAGYTFTPSSLNVTISGANITTGMNFTAAAQTFAISGTISPAAGGSGATVTLSGAAAATTAADGAGNYTFSGLGNATYTVTPTNTGFTFTPASQSVIVNSASISGVNFAASAQVTHSVALSWIASTTSTVSGYNVYRSTVSGTGDAKMNSSVVSVLIYTDGTVQNATTYYYVTTAVDGGGTESAYSNEVSAAIP